MSLSLTLAIVNERYLAPAAALLPSVRDTLDVRRMLLAIAWQETGLATLRQYGDGPAASLWQIERPTIRLVMTNPRSRELAKSACAAVGVKFDSLAIWLHFQTLDGQVLAAVFARLILLCDAAPIPRTEATGWVCYADRCWRPGKPHKDRWPTSWKLACAVVGAPA